MNAARSRPGAPTQSEGRRTEGCPALKDVRAFSSIRACTPLTWPPSPGSPLSPEIGGRAGGAFAPGVFPTLAAIATATGFLILRAPAAPTRLFVFTFWTFRAEHERPHSTGAWGGRPPSR